MTAAALRVWGVSLIGIGGEAAAIFLPGLPDLLEGLLAGALPGDGFPAGAFETC